MESSAWKYVPGNEYCLKVTDGTHDSPKQAECGKPLITSKHIKGDVIDFDTAYLISEHDFNEINKRSKVDQWDVIISMIGAYCGFCFIESNEEIEYAVKNVGLFKAGTEVNAKWLYYYLNSPIGRAHLDAVKSGSTQPYIALGALRNLPILVPRKDEAKEKIVAILDAIDTKIRVNNRINTELETMAKTLYDYWFVQFDFPDDSAQGQGKPYKTSGGKMVYNPILKREIPEGWSNAVLGEIINMERGVTYGKEDVLDKDNDNAIGVLRATNVTGNSVDINDLVYVPKSIVNQSQKIESFETIIVMSSGSKEHVGKNGIYYFDEPLGFGAFCSKIAPKKGARSFVNTFLQTTWFRAYIKNQCIGTNINNLTGDHINKCPIALPAKGLLEKFEEVTGDIYQMISVNAIENQKLAALRDWLLPMLMNGQVTVK